MYKILINNAKNYQPQLVSRISEPSTVAIEIILFQAGNVSRLGLPEAQRVMKQEEQRIFSIETDIARHILRSFEANKRQRD